MKNGFRIVLLSLCSVLTAFDTNSKPRFVESISDWYSLRNYHPSQRITNLVTAIALTDYGQKLFYVSDPKIIDDKAAFREQCNSGERANMLGCYKDDRIFVFGAPHSNLRGIVETVSAHELLHAGYARLSEGEKNRVIALIKKATDKNPEILKKLEEYRDDSAADSWNELHSFIGSEFASLPKDLEDYYARYFRNRSVVVHLHSQYQSAFDAQVARINRFDKDLDILKKQIQAEKAEIHRVIPELDKEQEKMFELRQQHDNRAYNMNVPRVNAHVTAFNAQVARLNAHVLHFNQLTQQRNEIAFEAHEMMAGIDTRLKER